jgi:hypothetical protein
MIDNREEFCWRAFQRSRKRRHFVRKRESFDSLESSHSSELR